MHSAENMTKQECPECGNYLVEYWTRSEFVDGHRTDVIELICPYEIYRLNYDARAGIGD